VVIIAQAADTQTARQRGVDAPKSGRVSDVLGMFSDMDSMKTENDSRIEMPSEIFSPWSGGDRNVTSVSDESMTHGMMRLSVKKRCRRTRWNDAATCRVTATRYIRRHANI